MRLLSIVLCFVALLIFTIPVSAIDDSFHWVSSSTDEVTTTAESNRVSVTYLFDNYLYFSNVEIAQDFSKSTLIVPNNSIIRQGGDGTSGWDTSVTFRIGDEFGDIVGTGIFGYSVTGANIRIQALVWDIDLSEYSGVVRLYIDDSTIGFYSVGGLRSTAWDDTTDNIVLFQWRSYYAGPGPYYTIDNIGGIGSITNTDLDYDYYNTYSYSSYSIHNSLSFNRTISNESKIILEIGGIEVVNETSFKSTEFTWINSTKTYDVWNLTVENIYGEVKTIQLEFTAGEITSVGTIELNQSSYTEPELIQIDAELITYDFSGHAYTTYLQWRDDVGNWNTVSYVEYNESIGFFTDDPTKSLVGDIDFYQYEIPLRLRAVLIDFNKNTYVSTTIAESNTVLYNPPAGALYLVTGTVVNADTDAVVSGATISVTGPMTQSDTTNVNGRFYLYLADGTYTFNTTKSGYENNVDTGIVINSDTSGIEIPLVPVQTDEGVIYGTITDSDTKNPLNDVHVIFSNATDTIHAYSASNGYYEAEGFNNDSVYAVRALKTGYYSYNGSITTETSGATHKSFDMVQTNYSATPIPTSVSTYPGGEGYEWTNDDIVTMLRILVPGIFLMMLIFLLLAVMMGFMPNNGGNQGGNSGLGELWRRK